MLRILFRAALQPFASHGLAAAAAFGGLAGMLVALSFWLFGDREAVRELRRRLWAHVLELRLFGDEPALAFCSLFGIAKINARLLAHAMPPLLIAAPVVGLLVVHLNDFFTHTPLQNGGAAVLTVRWRGPVSALVRLETPSWVQVNAPPVHIPSEGEVSWRLRATAPRRGVCTLSVPGESVTKELDARPGWRYSGRVRARAWLDSQFHPAEERLPDGPIERIWISPIPAPLTAAGVTMEWGEWFAIALSIAAWLFSLALSRLARPRLFHFLFHRL